MTCHPGTRRQTAARPGDDRDPAGASRGAGDSSRRTRSLNSVQVPGQGGAGRDRTREGGLRRSEASSSPDGPPSPCTWGSTSLTSAAFTGRRLRVLSAWAAMRLGTRESWVLEGALPSGETVGLRHGCGGVGVGASLADGLTTLAASSQLLPARSQMAFTLGFHIILASLGVAFPAMMLIANYLGLRRNDADALELAQRWSKVAAVTFAVGRRHRHRALVRVRPPVAGVHRSLRRGLRRFCSRSRASSSSSRRSSSRSTSTAGSASPGGRTSGPAFRS